jgi:hypothetical protein
MLLLRLPTKRLVTGSNLGPVREEGLSVQR